MKFDVAKICRSEFARETQKLAECAIIPLHVVIDSLRYKSGLNWEIQILRIRDRPTYQYRGISIAILYPITISV